MTHPTPSPTAHPHAAGPPGSGDPLLTLIAAAAAAGHVTVHNARGGFACNSSSSHSIVVLPDGLTLEADPPRRYGREDFALVDPGEKVRYLATMLRSDAAAAAALEPLLEQYGTRLEPDQYVDHESVLEFPHDFHGEALDRDFLTDFAALLTNPRVAILGGHEEGGDTRHFRDGMVKVLAASYPGWRARRDVTADGTSWWVLFNATDGTKVRLTLDPAALAGGAVVDENPYRYDALPWSYPADFVPAKAATPELVDVKLTDKCPYELDCGFSYLASTRDGTERDPVRVATLLTALAQLRVFEVAFGGGEPTVWPHLGATLGYARSLGIVPNFTTKNYAWMGTECGKSWLEQAGAVAFSVTTTTAMDQLTRKVDAADLTRAQNAKLTVQLIPDLVPTADFHPHRHHRGQARLAGHPPRLQAHRPRRHIHADVPPRPRLVAGQVRDHREGHVPALRRDRHPPREQSKAALDAAGVPRWLYTTSEGNFSAYVDAVTGQVGPSSYAGPGSLTPLDLDADPATVAAAFNAQFATYLPTDPAGSTGAP